VCGEQPNDSNSARFPPGSFCLGAPHPRSLAVSLNRWLVGSVFWDGLLAWMREVLVTEGMISAADLEMMRVVDTPDAVVDALFDFYDARGFEQSATEREKLLYL